MNFDIMATFIIQRINFFMVYMIALVSLHMLKLGFRNSSNFLF